MDAIVDLICRVDAAEDQILGEDDQDSVTLRAASRIGEAPSSAWRGGARWRVLRPRGSGRDVAPGQPVRPEVAQAREAVGDIEQNPTKPNPWSSSGSVMAAEWTPLGSRRPVGDDGVAGRASPFLDGPSGSGGMLRRSRRINAVDREGTSTMPVLVASLRQGATAPLLPSLTSARREREKRATARFVNAWTWMRAKEAHTARQLAARPIHRPARPREIHRVARPAAVTATASSPSRSADSSPESPSSSDPASSRGDGSRHKILAVAS